MTSSKWSILGWSVHGLDASVRLLNATVNGDK